MDFYSLVTDYGKEKQLICLKNGTPFCVSQMVLGDGNGKIYEPMSSQTEIKNEVWRGNIDEFSFDGETFYCISTVPAEVGGFVVREAGLVDEDNKLIVITKFPETTKQDPSTGVVKQLKIKIEIRLENNELADFIINPNLELATKDEIEILAQNSANVDLSNLSELGQAKFDAKADLVAAVLYEDLGERISIDLYDTSIIAGTTYEIID